MELALILEMAAGDDPERVAVTHTDGSALTRGDLLERARAAATTFAELDVDQIGYLDVNGMGLPIALFGAAIAHKPFVPFNYRLSDEQLTELLHRESKLAVVASGALTTRLRALGIDRIVDTASLYSPTSGPVADFAPGDPDDIAVLLYTSGTTSAPKAAVLRHRHLTSYVISTVEFGAAGTEDAVLVSVPPYHIAGVSTVLSNLYLGRRIVYLDPFDPHRWLASVEDQGVTHAMVVPTMLSRIVDATGGQAPDIPTLRSLAYGGAPMPRPVIERALDLMPSVDFTNAYGLTETSSTITVLGPEDHRNAMDSEDPDVRSRLQSAGRAVPGVEIVVRTPEGHPCAPGSVGDVYVRGEQVSGEYLGSGSAVLDGWFPTKDRGWLDEDGFLFIEGRSDDTIIRGGENIAPAEIEDALLQHPAVAECAVVGLPDEEWGHRIAAAVVLRSNIDPPSPSDLQDWARERLRSSKTPDLISIRQDLPYTDTGKLLRRDIRAALTEIDP